VRSLRSGLSCLALLHSSETPALHVRYWHKADIG
jgi:hypothetical protein